MIYFASLIIFCIFFVERSIVHENMHLYLIAFINELVCIFLLLFSLRSLLFSYM